MKRKIGLLVAGAIMTMSLSGVVFAESSITINIDKNIDIVVPVEGIEKPVAEIKEDKIQEKPAVEIEVEVIKEEIVETTGSDKGNNFYAEELSKLDVLKGTAKGLELGEELTRAQGMVIYFRLLGLKDSETETKAQKLGTANITPFTDVPTWAIKEINYLYAEGLVKGISNTQIGSNNKMNAKEFTTLVLRAIGLRDDAGDFVWSESIDKAVEIGLLSKGRAANLKTSGKFTRGDMSYIAYSGMETMLSQNINENNNKAEEELPETEEEVEVEKDTVEEGIKNTEDEVDDIIGGRLNIEV